MKLALLFIFGASSVAGSPLDELIARIGAIESMLSTEEFMLTLTPVQLSKWKNRLDGFSIHLEGVLARCGDITR